LTKIENEKDKEKKLWGRLLKTETMEELEMVAKESPEMAEAADKLLVLSADKHAQAYAFSRESSEFARRLHEQGIRDESREEGRKEEKEENIVKTISIMRELGTDESIIAEKLKEKYELSDEEVEKKLL